MLLQDIEAFKNLDLLASQVVKGFITGLHSSPFHGFSVEFAQHKPYNPGDNIRNIDWKLLARSNKLFVKQFDEETNLRCRLLLDVSPSMHYPVGSNLKLKYATLAAAAICQMLKKQRDAFGISSYNNGILQHTEIKSNERHYINLINILQTYWQSSTTPIASNTNLNLPQTIDFIASTSPKRSLFVILSDMLDEHAQDPNLWQALQHLKHGKNEIIIFHISHASTEELLQFEDREYKFKNLETKENLILNPQEIRKQYIADALLFHKELLNKCLHYKIDYHHANVEEDFNQLLLTFYQKRKRMLV